MRNIRFTFILLLTFVLNNNLSGQIMGTRLIDQTGAGDYTSINQALTDIGLVGISGNVIFLIKGGIYSEQLLFDNFNFGGDTIFFIPAMLGDMVEIQFAPTGMNYLVNFNNSSNIIFANINMTNINNDGMMSGTVIDFSGNCNNITLDSCSINGVYTVSMDESYSVIHHNDLDGANVCNDIKIVNCNINSGSKAIFFKGFNSGEFENVFDGNYITGFSSTGIEIDNQNMCSIRKNYIQGDYSGDTEMGVSIINANAGFVDVSRNDIYMNAVTSNFGINAINNQDSIFITNNMINVTTGSAINNALNFEANQHLYIFHNSTYIGYLQSGTNINLGAGNNSLDVNILNNIMQNDASSSAYMVYLTEPIAACNHNIYYSESGASIGFDGATSWSIFSDWQLNTSYDGFSNFVNPNFNSPGYDLHINRNFWGESKAVVTMHPILFDFDGEPRVGEASYVGEGLVPDIGADEGEFGVWIAGVSGEIFDGTVWDRDTVVVGDVWVNEGSTLIVNPGVKVSVIDSAYFDVYGRMLAIGNETEKITFTAENPNGWGGINLSSFNDSVSIFKYCNFEFANTPGYSGGALSLYSDSVIVDYCSFTDNHAMAGAAIYITGCAPKITHSYFKNNTADNLGGALLLVEPVAKKNNSKVVPGMTNPVINNNIFENNNSYSGGGAIAFNYVTGVQMWNNTIINNNSEIAFGGRDLYFVGSTVDLYNNIIWNNVNPDSTIFIDINSSIGFYNCNLPNGFSLSNILDESLMGKGFYDSGTNISADPVFNGTSGFQYQLSPISPCVNAGYSPSPYPLDYTDFAGQPRVSCITLDIGAFEFDGCPLIADAGLDQSLCGKTTQLNALDSASFEGYWSVIAGSGNFANVNSPSTFVTNMGAGDNIFLWTVTDGYYTISDDVIITNIEPYVYAGDDINSFSVDYGSSFPQVTITGNDPGSFIGAWSQLSGPSTIIISSITPSITVDVQYGISSFIWTIMDSFNECENSDTIFVMAGYSFVSAPDDGILDWNNPADWDVGATPGPSDSVTIYNCNASIIDSNYTCGSIVIGNNSNLKIGGSAKGIASLTAKNLIIEESTVKFKSIKGSAVLELTDYSTLNIDDPDPLNLVSDAKLIVGPGGTIFVHSASAKDGKAIGEAGLNIGSGGRLFISQTAEKDNLAVGEALVEIGSGGRLFISQTAEKSSKVVAGGNINIGSGGRLFIHQTAEKAASGGIIELGSGGRIFISQTAEKAVSGGTLDIGSGGRLFISQTAEKSIANDNSGISIGSGGRLFIHQTAEKAVDTAMVTVPVIDLNGGMLLLGDNSGGDKMSILNCENLNIGSGFLKAVAQDTNVYVYSNGLLAIYNDIATSAPGLISMNVGTNFTVEENGLIDLSQVANDPKAFYISSGASFIDKNMTSNTHAQALYYLVEGENTISSFFADAITNPFTNEFNVSKFDEGAFDFTAVYPGETFVPLTGYFVDGVSSLTYKMPEGTLNTGDLSIPVTTNSIDPDRIGWNFLGNPYPSAIVWDSLEFNGSISPTYYVYNSTNDNFEIYQKGGITLNNATGYILAQQSFFVKTQSADNFNMKNSARIHYNALAVPKAASYQNLLKLRVSDGVYSDEAALMFSDLATDEFDYFDAAKFPVQSNYSPEIYTVSGISNQSFAINAIPLNVTETIIPLNFYSNIAGSYTLSIAESSIDSAVSVFLRDIYLDGAWIDFKANPSYVFDNIVGQDEARFELKFTGEMINVENDVISKEVEVYSNAKDIYINNPELSNITIQVFDINGKMLKVKTINTMGLNVLNTNLPTGIYFVKSISDTKTLTHKIIIH